MNNEVRLALVGGVLKPVRLFCGSSGWSSRKSGVKEIIPYTRGLKGPSGLFPKAKIYHLIGKLLELVGFSPLHSGRGAGGEGI
jgi:hypothetical protein